MKTSKFKIVNGRWKTGNLNDALVSSKFDKFINSKREEKQVFRSKINKEHNYIFKA